jgi:threonine synthase
MDCVVLLPAGKIAKGKLAQALVYGAKVVTVDGNFDVALRLVREIGGRDDFEIVNSINPFRLEGQKTAAFEIVDCSDAASPRVAGGQRGQHHRLLERLPGVSGAGQKHAIAADARVSGGRSRSVSPWASRGKPGDGGDGDPHRQSRELGRSDGSCARVEWGDRYGDDEEILDAQRWLASHEGIFVEPASAASIAGLLKCTDRGRRCDRCPLPMIEEGSVIVCTATGMGQGRDGFSAEFPVYEAAAKTGRCWRCLGRADADAAGRLRGYANTT